MVACPQEGIVKSAAAEALMREGLKAGVDVGGRMPFNECMRRKISGGISKVFDSAREFDADSDMHVDGRRSNGATLEVLPS